MDEILHLRDLTLKDKRVIMRVDFNVPIDELGQVRDNTRIQASLPSINYVLEQGASLILMSHMGRPKGQPVKSLSLEVCARELEKLIKQPVALAPDCVGSAVEQMAHSLKAGQILLLENLRFYPAETDPDKDPTFASSLASLADYYVNEAFSASHRKHSSITEITKYFSGKSAAGFLLEKEIDYLGARLKNPKRPFYALLGGAKVSSKIGVLESLSHKVDALFIGGAMAYTFLKAQGSSIGDSLYEENQLTTAQRILSHCQSQNIPLFLPIDTVTTSDISSASNIQTFSAQDGIPEGSQGVDIGPKTVDIWIHELKKAGTILWNGPFGVFEVDPFSKGTNAIAQALGDIKAETIVGGGDSIAALKATQADRYITHISTGGGACIEYIQFGQLPGIEHLSKRAKSVKARSNTTQNFG